MEEKKGVYKKKGAAEESDAQEAKNDVNDMEGGMKNAGDVKGVSKKKGAGRTVKQLKDKKQEMQDTKAHKKMGVKAYNKKIQRLNKKIERKGGAKHIDGKEHGAANYEDGYPPAGSGKKKGASKKKGSADYSFDEGSHDHPHGGPGRMGFTQNFGPARQNSYAKGAAKVASIMGYGASKKKGAADDTGSPHPPHPDPSSPATVSSINSDIESFGNFEGTEGGGGYANYGGDNFASNATRFPKGVMQDYRKSGGNMNPVVGRAVLQKALNFAKKSTGNNTNTPFKENMDPGSYVVNMSRANYSPSDGFSGIDPQTGNATTFGSGGGGMKGSKVESFSNSFQEAMRLGIKNSKFGVGENLNQSGVAAPPSIKANTLTTPIPTNSPPPPPPPKKKGRGLFGKIGDAIGGVFESNYKFTPIGKSTNKNKNVYR